MEVLTRARVSRQRQCICDGDWDFGGDGVKKTLVGTYCLVVGDDEWI